MHNVASSSSQGTGLLEQLRELALFRLQVRVSSNVLLVDEHIWNSALRCHLGQSVLDLAAIVDLVELNRVELSTGLAEHRLGCAAVGAV